MGCNAGREPDAKPGEREMTTYPACAAPEQNLLQDLHDGALDPATARQVADHAATCAHCGPELSDLREFDAAMRSAHLSSDEVVEAAWGGPSATEPHLQLCMKCRDEVAAIRTARVDAGSDSRERRTSWAVPLALAATVVIGVGLALQREPNRPPDATTRGEILKIDGLSPQGEVSRAASEMAFAWRGQADGRYALLFFTEDGRPLARTETLGTRYVVPPAERSRLEALPVFFWKVESLAGPGVGPDSQLVRVSWAP